MSALIVKAQVVVQVADAVTYEHAASAAAHYLTAVGCGDAEMIGAPHKRAEEGQFTIVYDLPNFGERLVP